MVDLTLISALPMSDPFQKAVWQNPLVGSFGSLALKSWLIDSPKPWDFVNTSSPSSYLKFESFGFNYNPNENDMNEYEMHLWDNTWMPYTIC